MGYLFTFFAMVLGGLVTNIGEAWDALPESPDRSNLGLGKHRFGIAVLVADLVGLIISFLSGIAGIQSWMFMLIIPCFVFTVFALFSLVVNRRGWLPPSGQSREGQSLRWLKVATVAVFVVVAFVIGTLFGDHNSEQVLRWSRYHVEGTKTNGSGFLNECSEPSPCAGKNPVGRLYDGDPVYIECQVWNDLAKSKGGQTSHIWDRLYSGAFVSDLFVSTPGVGRFSKGLPNCTSWK